VRVVEYIYDAWGKLISTTGTLATTLGADNPFRYRGYYYDTETGLYYLTTRYYDPEVCRFISADVYMSTGQGVLGGNMWAYCLNNPVVYTDDGGTVAVVDDALLLALLALLTDSVYAFSVVESSAPSLVDLDDILSDIGESISWYYWKSFVTTLFAATILTTPMAERDSNIITSPNVCSEPEDSYSFYREHRKGARKSTKNKHQEGNTRRKKDNRGEKGDLRRPYVKGNTKKVLSKSARWITHTTY